MTSPSSQPPEQEPARAGKTRTWWHPLLASLLRWQLGNHYQLQEEVPVGQKPLQIDILLLHKEQGELPESARRILAGLVERLGEYTLLEFKSPSDTLRAGDFQTFLAYALLYRAQNQPLMPLERMHMLVLAPRLTGPYRDELTLLGVTPQEQEPGIWLLQGGRVLHPTWVLETERLVGLEHPLLTLVSPSLLKNRIATYDIMKQGGYTELMAHLTQQISQFSFLGKEFAMQHLGAENEMTKILCDLWDAMTDEERERALPKKQRLKGLTPEERREGLSVKEWLLGLTAEEREQLRQLLQQPPPDESDSNRQ
jgi:hypothetical protein